MNRKTVLGIMAALILFTCSIGLFNIPAVGFSEEWITVTSYIVEMSIENKTTHLGKELSILMVAPSGASLPDTQVFDVYLYDSNYSLFSCWSWDKYFLQMIWGVSPGYNETLKWNLYSIDPYTPPPPGDYYLVGAIMPGPADFTPPILIRIDATTITPIAIVVPPEPENLPPIANFTYSPTFPIVSETVTFDASSSYDPDGTIVNYSWAFGDETGANDTGPITTHVYADAGNYSVTLYVYDDYYQGDSYTLNVTVTHQQVPVEATQELIETIETWNLPEGTENSLRAKLKVAIHMLDMEKEDGAIRKLTDFIDRVEMLREDTLTNEQADYLTSEAQRIIDLIEG